MLKTDILTIKQRWDSNLSKVTNPK